MCCKRTRLSDLAERKQVLIISVKDIDKHSHIAFFAVGYGVLYFAVGGAQPLLLRTQRNLA